MSISRIPAFTSNFLTTYLFSSTTYLCITPGAIEMRLLFVLLLLVPDAACDSHRLQYFVTTAPVPIPGLPKYSIIGYIDDMPYGKYTSETQRAEIFYKWLDEKTDPEHWKEMTQRAHNFERYHRDITRLIRVLFNQTTDKHILQVKLECELHDDGTINGGLEFGYDGEEIIAFDKERVIFIPMHQEAQYITQKWNIDGMIRNKDLIERDCIRWIKMYFRLGQNKLERKVPPKVDIFGHQSDTVTKLHCLAYGFYPRAVDAKWVKNSKDDVYSDEAKQILPNPDGTYQIRVTVEIIPKDGDTYSCHIDHSSLNNTMIVLWEPNRTSILVIVIVITILAVVALSGIGICIYRTVSNQHQRVNTQAT